MSEITAEQARQLLPLLQQIANATSTLDEQPVGMPPVTSESLAGSSAGSLVGIDSGVPSEPDTPVGIATTAPMDCSLAQEYPSAPPKFTAEELLARKSRGQCSTKAQSQFNYAVRESAKAAGFWNKAPELKNIPAGELCLFYKHLLKICPQLKDERQMVRIRLTDALMNRRGYLRRVESRSGERKPSRKQLKPTQSAKQQVKSTSSTSTIQEYPNERGIVVDIIHNDETIGIGILVSAEVNDIFVDVVFKSFVKKTSNISLYVALDDKIYFHQLQVADVFVWKASKLRIRETKKYLIDTLSQLDGDDKEKTTDHETASKVKATETTELTKIKKMTKPTVVKTKEPIVKTKEPTVKPKEPTVKTKEPTAKSKKIVKTKESTVNMKKKKELITTPIHTLKTAATGKKRKLPEITPSTSVGKKRKLIKQQDKMKKDDKYWRMVDTDKYQEKDIFKTLIITEWKRSSKPTPKLKV